MTAGGPFEGFGPFVLLKPLGAGGMGTAHLATHPGTDGLLVVKRMHPGMIQEPTLFKRFIHEAEVASHVQHPNVAALVAMGTVDGEPFLATEFVFGIQVSQIVHRIQNAAVDPLPLQVGLQMGVELVAGLNAIHQARHKDRGLALELVHRDVGARNVLVGFDGGVRLIDLGLGKSMLSDWETAAEVLAGSPDYMPPEQVLGEAVDARADVYAATVVVWELLAGVKRIQEETIALRIRRALDAKAEPLLDRRPDASPRLERLLQAGMDPDPERRLASAAELQAGLEAELARVRRVYRHDAVREWLDAACATIIARERRALQQLRGSVPQFADSVSQVEMIVGGVQGWAPIEREVEPVKGPPSRLEHLQHEAAYWGPYLLSYLSDPGALARAPIVPLLAFSVAFATVVCMAAGLTAWWLMPARPEAEMLATGDPAPLDAVRDPPEIPAAATATLAERGPVSAAPSKARPADPRVRPLPPALRAQKRALLGRLRALRKVKYEVRWQRQLTSLSARLSRARSPRALGQIDAALTRLEKAR